MSEEIETIEGEKCPICGANELVLMEAEREIPFFGKVALFSMDCNACKYHKADIESIEEHEGAKYSIDVEGEEDLKIRVVKSSNATVKIAHVGSIEPGESSNGYVTNIEGILNRMKHQVEFIRDNAEDNSDAKKAKNILKKLQKVLWGQEKIKITLEDPTGNSAIITDKAEKKVMKGKK